MTGQQAALAGLGILLAIALLGLLALVFRMVGVLERALADARRTQRLMPPPAPAPATPVSPTERNGTPLRKTYGGDRGLMPETRRRFDPPQGEPVRTYQGPPTPPIAAETAHTVELTALTGGGR